MFLKKSAVLATVGAALALTAATAPGAQADTASTASVYACHQLKGWYSGTAITQLGDTGNRVIELQCDLKWAGYLSSSQVDGVFGSKTLAAVKSFQGMYHRVCNPGVVVDGIVGPYTWAALRSACPA